MLGDDDENALPCTWSRPSAWPRRPRQRNVALEVQGRGSRMRLPILCRPGTRVDGDLLDSMAGAGRPGCALRTEGAGTGGCWPGLRAGDAEAAKQARQGFGGPVWQSWQRPRPLLVLRAGWRGAWGEGGPAGTGVSSGAGQVPVVPLPLLPRAVSGSIGSFLSPGRAAAKWMGLLSASSVMSAHEEAPARCSWRILGGFSLLTKDITAMKKNEMPMKKLVMLRAAPCSQGSHLSRVGG